MVVIPEVTPACIPEAGDKHGGQHIEEPSSDISNMAVRDASMGDDGVSPSGGTSVATVSSIAQGMEHLILCVHHDLRFLASLDAAKAINHLGSICASNMILELHKKRFLVEKQCWDWQRFFSFVRGCILC